MKILIVDDRSEKAGQIKRIIRDSGEVNEEDIQIELDLTGARSQLRKVLFDLLILDLNIPESICGEPSVDIGISFIDEICNTKSFNIPLDIVALTAFSEAKQKFSSDPRLAGFAILQYDVGLQDWQDYIISRIKYLNICNQQRKIEKRLPDCDVFWLTAVDVETEALKKLFSWTPFSVANDASLYYCTEYEAEGQSIHIVRTQLTEMGMTSAASITTKAIMHFSPKYIIMTGIAAGLDNDLKIGDVMIASHVWNYDSGKYTEVEENGSLQTKLKPDGKTDNLTEENLGILHAFRDNTKSEVKPMLGIFACGNSVVASALKVSEDIKAHSRKTIGVDMESYGVMFAARVSCNPPITAFVIKGISDKADTKKNDEHQKTAAENSALVAKDLIRFLYKYNTGEDYCLN